MLPPHIGTYICKYSDREQGKGVGIEITRRLHLISRTKLRLYEHWGTQKEAGPLACKQR